MPEYIRVKCKSTKGIKSIPVGSSLEGWEVLKDEPATNADGTPLPDKPFVDLKSLSSPSDPGQEAATPKGAK